jgi:sulfocyanin SoxE-like protein
MLFDRVRRDVHRAIVSVAILMASVVLSGGRRDPEFMRYDAEARRVDLTIIAAFDQSNSGYNFNGGSRGRHRITVPLGWRVVMTFENRDVMPHSAAVIREAKYVPVRIIAPAFRHAATSSIERGLPVGGREDGIEFVAERPGSYLIACGVPGHAVVGTYLRFVVSGDATVPTYETNVVAMR